MTTLPTLIQQLRTHRPDSLTDLREAIAVVAEAVVANDGETTHVRHVAVLRSEEDRQLRADIERMTADRDRLAAEVKTIAETTERETVERIAAWLLTNVYDDVARNQIVEIIRRGDWRTK